MTFFYVFFSRFIIQTPLATHVSTLPAVCTTSPQSDVCD